MSRKLPSPVFTEFDMRQIALDLKELCDHFFIRTKFENRENYPNYSSWCCVLRRYGHHWRICLSTHHRPSRQNQLSDLDNRALNSMRNRRLQHLTRVVGCKRLLRIVMQKRTLFLLLLLVYNSFIYSKNHNYIILEKNIKESLGNFRPPTWTKARGAREQHGCPAVGFSDLIRTHLF